MKTKVAFIGQPEYFRFTYEHDLNEVAEVGEFKFNYSMSFQDLREVLEFGADFNIFFRGEFVPPGVLEGISGIKIALSSEPFPRILNGHWEYTADSVLRYLAFRRIRNRPFDYVFHYDQAGFPLFEKDGLFLSGVFPFPVATQTYVYKDIPKKWDLFFIGRSTPYREKWFERLKHHFNFLHISHGIWGPDLVDYINSSKICLNIHAENEISWEPRVQMMLATNAFVMSEKLTPNEYIRPGLDYLEVSDPKDAFDKVSHFLAHGVERKKIADSGYHRVRKVLDGRSQFLTLFEKIGSGCFAKFRFEKGSLKFDLLGAGVQTSRKFKRFKSRMLG